MVNPYIRFLPNYLSTFLPIVTVMIANPILYRLAFSRVEQQIMSVQGRCVGVRVCVRVCVCMYVCVCV